ncbi:MAG: phage shock protein PspA [Chromatiaceae bacterium]|jgi:phage shock protein A|nr:phage shock protein PspA [Chromatiaceae bacterium]
MSIFSRMTDIIHSNINALLDKAEDPAKMVRLMIQEMEDTVVEVRATAVKSIADKKNIARRLERLEAASDEWQEKAEFALSKDREDLARAALVAKRKLADQAQHLRVELAVVEECLSKYDDDLAQLQSKLNEARAKKKALEIRMSAASKRVAIRRRLNDGRIDEAMARYATLEQRIDELEADAEAYDLGKKRSLEDEFSDLVAENGVEDELDAIKVKLAEKHSA